MHLLLCVIRRIFLCDTDQIKHEKFCITMNHQSLLYFLRSAYKYSASFASEICESHMKFNFTTSQRCTKSEIILNYISNSSKYMMIYSVQILIVKRLLSSSVNTCISWTMLHMCMIMTSSGIPTSHIPVGSYHIMYARWTSDTNVLSRRKWSALGPCLLHCR